MGVGGCRGHGNEQPPRHVSLHKYGAFSCPFHWLKSFSSFSTQLMSPPPSGSFPRSSLLDTGSTTEPLQHAKPGAKHFIDIILTILPTPWEVQFVTPIPQRK